MCPVCEDLFIELAVKVDGVELIDENTEGVKLEEEDKDNVGEYGSDSIDTLEAKLDVDLELELVEPTVIPILERKISPICVRSL